MGTGAFLMAAIDEERERYAGEEQEYGRSDAARELGHHVHTGIAEILVGETLPDVPLKHDQRSGAASPIDKSETLRTGGFFGFRGGWRRDCFDGTAHFISFVELAR